MSKESQKLIQVAQVKLAEKEALKLANELKEKIRTGDKLDATDIQIQRMIAGLGDKRGLVRRTFVKSLGLVGKPAIPALQDALLKNPSVTVRRAAAKTLKLVGEQSALTALLKALINDPDPVVQGSAVGAMAIFGEAAAKLLLEVLKNPNSTPIQCGLASWGLAFVGSEAPKALREAAISTDPKIRAAAIAALGEQIQSLEDSAARELVKAALNDPVVDVRAEATSLLGRLQDAKFAEPLLIQRLNDSDAQVRRNAAFSLMRLESFSTIEQLKRRIQREEDPQVINVLQLAINHLMNFHK